MKKLLLLLFAVLTSMISGISLFAQTQTKTIKFDFVSNAYGFHRDSGNGSDTYYITNGTEIQDDNKDITVKFDGVKGQEWRLWTDGMH